MKRSSSKKTAVIYARVSSREQEQEGYSIDSQLKFLQTYAAKNGLTVIDHYVEAESARTAGRTKLKQMLSFLRQEASPQKTQGNPCRVLLVEKTDRLTRNHSDMGEAETLVKEFGVEIHLAKEGQVISRGSKSSENLMFGIKASISKYYSDNLSEEVRKGMTEKAQQGHYPSLAPIGYRNRRYENKSILDVDPVAAPFIKKMFELYATGQSSLLKIKKELQAEGFRHPRTGAIVQINQIHTILKNPLYYGAFKWDGTIYPGKHTPLVSKELFEVVQARFAFSGSHKPRAKKYSWAFTGLIKCGQCGSSMTAERKKGKYVYYHCSFARQRCEGSYVREEVLEVEFLRALRGLELDGETLEWVTEIFRLSHAEKRELHDGAVKALQAHLKQTQTRLDKAFETYLDGKIDSESFERATAKWREEQSNTQKQIDAHNRADRAYMETATKLIELVQGFVSTYESQPLAEKRKLLDFVVSNSVWKDGALEVVLKKPFDILAVTVAKEREEREKLKPVHPEGEQALKWLGR